jgi:N-acetylglucosamine transport system substrate-binding protein
MHMNDPRVTVARLEREAAQRVSRRRLLSRALVVSLSAPTIASLLSACSGGGGGGTAAPTTGPAAPAAKPTSAAGAAPGATAATAPQPAGQVQLPTGAAKNPLNVKADAPLDVVIFKGGFGDDYAINAEKIYQANFPDAKISHQGIQRLQEQLQPRFVGGNPPDVIDNSGAGNLDNAALIADEQLADLGDLMAAPSFDTEGKSFKDTLLQGSQDNGVYDGKQYLLNLVYSVYGLWYSDSLFKKNGWQYPKTWDEMLQLCETIKKTGIAPWTYQGKYPSYMLMVLNQMVYKTGGMEAIKSIDNLEPNAWKQPAVQSAVNALYQLAAKDYIMPGTEGLSHTESQTAWLQGKAAFIPCGNWLENEMKGLIPDGFNMVIQPTPSATSSDKVGFEGIQGGGGEPFIVPSKGKNVQGGKEYLRALMSKQGARFFSQNTRALSTVVGASEGLDLGTAFASVDQAVKAAGSNTFVAQYGDWYKKLNDDVSNAMGSMLNKRMTPDQFMDTAQQLADAIAQDNSVKKYHR